MPSHITVGGHIKRGFLSAFLWISVIVWLTVAFIAIGTGMSATDYPAVFGWIALLIMAVVAWLTAERWARILPGMFVVAAFNAAYAIETGHLAEDARATFSRSTVGVMTGAFVITAYLLTAYINRKLTTVDRVVLCSVIALLLIAFTQRQLALPSTVAIPLLLVTAWVYRRFRKQLMTDWSAPQN